ncbi:MAG: ImmA/IrrE family metallo-endopeptidase [Faecalibacterium sp.]
MTELLNKTLYKLDNNRFQALKVQAKAFNVSFTGSNIIQDDIFYIMENYAARNNAALKIFKLPIADEDFCAFTCVRKGIIFVVINSSLPLAKQIFAAAHELYHIHCYLSEDDMYLQEHGSLLTSGILDENAEQPEDREANAFASLLLVPSITLAEQMEIHNIDRTHIDIASIVKLMEIFAVPFKAMVLRLHEENDLNERAAIKFLAYPTSEVSNQMNQLNLALRWNTPPSNQFDCAGLSAIIKHNIQEGFLPESRTQEDLARIQELSAILANDKRGV